MARDDLEYLTLADFTPGIHDRWGASSTLGKDGAAQVSDGTVDNRHTYGCYGDPAGGLHPLPRLIRTYTRDTTTDENYPAVDKVGVMDVAIISPVAQVSSIDGPPWQVVNSAYPLAVDHPDLIHMLTSHRGPAAWESGMPVSTWRTFRLAAYNGDTDLNTYETIFRRAWAAGDEGTSFSKVGTSGYTWSTLWALNYQIYPVGGWASGCLAVGKSIQYVPDGDSVTLEQLSEPGLPCVLGAMALSSYSMHRDATPDLVPIFFSPWGGPNTIARPGDLGYSALVDLQYPGETARFYNNYTRAHVPSYILHHQDRFVCKRYEGVGNPIGTGIHTQRDLWRYSELNAVMTRATRTEGGNPDSPQNPFDQYSIYKTDAFLEVPGSENLPLGPPADVYLNDGEGTGAAVSYNSDLVIFKQRGGAAVVRGSLEDPQVVALPGVPSVGVGAIHHPAITPLGVMYGTRDGVFMWNGEPTAECVSPQLSGFFWDCGEDSETGVDQYRKYEGSRGRFAYNYPFVYLPNNWVFDTRTGGWTRLTDPTEENPYPYMHYVVSSTGAVYAVRGCYDDDNQGVIDLYDHATRATSYQWVSQPILSSINRELDVEELVLVAQGEGEVMVRLIGIDDSEDVHTFHVDSPLRPQRLVHSANCKASEMTVVISSVGASTSTDAPVVHALHIGSTKSRQVVRS